MENSGSLALPLLHSISGEKRADSAEKIQYLAALKQELDKIPENLEQTRILLSQEIERVQKGILYHHTDIIPLHSDKLIKASCKIRIPTKSYHHINFPLRILGVNGENLNQLCKDTKTQIGLFGKGSVADRHKEEEYKSQNSPKYQHLHEPMYILIEAVAFPAEAFARVAHVLNELVPFLNPDHHQANRQN